MIAKGKILCDNCKMGNENESKEKKGKSLEKLPYVFNYTQHYDIHILIPYREIVYFNYAT